MFNLTLFTFLALLSAFCPMGWGQGFLFATVFPTTISRCPGFQTHIRRFPPDWDLWRTELKCRGCYILLKNYQEDLPDWNFDDLLLNGRSEGGLFLTDGRRFDKKWIWSFNCGRISESEWIWQLLVRSWLEGSHPMNGKILPRVELILFLSAALYHHFLQL